MIFSDFPPRNIVKLENVGPTLFNFRPLLSCSSVATTVETTFVTSMAHFRFMATSSQDIQVALNHGDTTLLLSWNHEQFHCTV